MTVVTRPEQASTVPEPSATPPQVPPRPQSSTAGDPIVETLRNTERPQLPPTFPPERGPQESSPANPAPPVSPNVLQPPQSVAGIDPMTAVMPGALGSLMQALLNQRRDVGSQFFMLLVPEESPPSVHTFDTVEDLRNAIKPNLGTSTYVFCFMGHALRVTKGPFHFLQTPYGAIPLHDLPTVAEQDSIRDGWVGAELPVTEFVRQPEATVAAIPTDGGNADGSDDDFEYADDDETELFGGDG